MINLRMRRGNILKKFFWKIFATKAFAWTQNFFSIAYLVLKLLQNIVHGVLLSMVVPPLTFYRDVQRIKRFQINLSDW